MLDLGNPEKKTHNFDIVIEVSREKNNYFKIIILTLTFHSLNDG